MTSGAQTEETGLDGLFESVRFEGSEPFERDRYGLPVVEDDGSEAAMDVPQRRDENEYVGKQH